MAHTFHCSLVTPEQELFDNEVTYASLPGWDGQIGVAPQRAPLLVELGVGPLRVDFVEGGSAWYFIGGGFAQMKDNDLSLVVSEATPAHNIVKQEARAALEAAEAAPAAGDEAIAERQRKVQRARAMLYLAEHHGQRI